mmetsp:Transcript_39838/g.103105  ORF Transcript_39838/g.103105 Transcript_39838/m.103105 type:complete len:233 (-) Transcript_39838:14-712(-)
MGDDADRPHIRLAVVHTGLHLRRRVASGPTGALAGGSEVCCREAKVDELHVRLRAVILGDIHHVAQLDVAMHEALGVKIVQRAEQLSDDVGRSGLTEFTVIDHALAYVSTPQVVEDQVHLALLLRSEDLSDRRDVGVGHETLDGDFPTEIALFPPGHLLQVVGLDSDRLAGLPAHGDPHCASQPLAKDPPGHHVLVAEATSLAALGLRTILALVAKARRHVGAPRLGPGSQR